MASCILCKQISTNDYNLKYAYLAQKCQGIFPKNYEKYL